MILPVVCAVALSLAACRAPESSATTQQEKKDQRVVWNCRDLSANEQNTVDARGFGARIYHRPGDPDSIHRIEISWADLKVELLPSKGLSVGQALYRGRPLFWDPPFDMPDVEKLDLQAADIAINGEFQQGLAFLRTFMGGIELYGLSNWGMHYRNEDTGEFHPLHGSSSNVPVDSVEVSISDRELRLRGSFVTRTYDRDARQSWYLRGTPTFEVTRTVVLRKGRSEIELRDRFRNVSDVERAPDLGYHVTFRAEKGARLLVPGKTWENRGGGEIPGSFDVWPPSEDVKKRAEVGVIHKNLMITKGLLDGRDAVRSIVAYPDGTGISVATPYMPYYQSWLCSGGAGSLEMTDLDGESILIRPWNGIGVELGSTALDHDGNTDPAFAGNFRLAPGSSLELPIRVEMHDRATTSRIVGQIEAYKATRNGVE